MGKAARNNRNKKKQFYKNPNVREEENNVSKEILYGLDSTNPQTRISTSGAISALFGDVQSDMKFSEDLNNQYKENLKMVVGSPLLKKIIGRATDSEYLVCMNVLGALRNMCIVGGDEFIKVACECNVMLPLKNLLYKNMANLQSAKETDQLIGCNIYLQLFSLLTIIFDYDPSGLFEIESEGEQSIFSVMLYLLSFSPSTSARLASIAQQMQAAVAEFICVMGDSFSSNLPFLQELHRRCPSLSWPLRFKLVGIFLPSSSLSDQLSLLEEACSLLASSHLADQLAVLQSCYDRFAVLQQKLPETPEETVDDADASRRMETEALDAGVSDPAANLVNDAADQTQKIEAFLNVLDVLARLLEQMDIPAVSPAVSNHVREVLAGTLTQLQSLGTAGNARVESLRQKLLAATLETIAPLLRHLAADAAVAQWPQLCGSLRESEETAMAGMRACWAWAQRAQELGLEDGQNPACFLEQLEGLLSVMSENRGEMVVTAVSVLSKLLSVTCPGVENGGSLRRVCESVVHVLDRPENVGDVEVVAAVLDFMMTIFGDERYVGMFREMQVTKYVYDATSALQGLIGKVEVDADCAEYLEEILSNAVRFIDWIQSGMK